MTFGPDTGWGSWEWVGRDVMTELSQYFHVATWSGPSTEADVAVFVKFLPDIETLQTVARHAHVVYCPVDRYGSAAEIASDAESLLCCTRIVVHCRRIAPYFQAFATVHYMDHHIKFVPSSPCQFRTRGDFLWVGVRTNLPPLVSWLDDYSLPGQLHVLTNLENKQAAQEPSMLGFRASTPVQLHEWSADLQLAMLQQVRGVLDIKGGDFRQRHKPPAKAIDMLAAGAPLAMNGDSSSVDHLAEMGFDVANPLDLRRWLSVEYWRECSRFGAALRELLSLNRVGRRWRRLVDAVLSGAS